MKKRTILAIVVLLSLCHFGFSQDVILMTIDDKKVSIDEFERIYKKNNTKDNAIDAKSLEEYLELFINFKLKVIEAEALKMDTVSSFITELGGYRKQLAKPYLTDKEMEEEVLKEAYERMKYDVHASHILLRLDPTAKPEDTLVVYNKAIAIRNRIVTKGEDFSKVATETTEDEYGKGNGGDLGYFTAFRMVYPFESAAFETKVGEVSMPIRTSFGYHLVKVNDKRLSLGKIKVAHIMVAVPQGSGMEEEKKLKEKIFSVHSQLTSGGNFEELAVKYSDDKGSAKKGGELAMFGTGQMVPEFEKVAFSLNNIGDISQPVQTSIGWHIIKLLEKQPMGSYEELKTEIKSKISRDARASKSRKSIVEKLKKEYNYQFNKGSLEAYYAVVDAGIFEGKWDSEKAASLDKTLCSFGEKTFNQKDFTSYLAKTQRKSTESIIKEFVDSKFNQFVEDNIIEYEESHLEFKHKDFRFLMQEYHDGILLFELTDKMVWSKAVQDTSGLKAFHESHKDNYMWAERVDATIYTVSNEKYVETAKKLATKRVKKGGSIEDFKVQFAAATKDTTASISVVDNKFSKGDNNIIDKVKWEPGLSENIKEINSVTFVSINKLLPVQPKLFNEARGLVTADYQTFLETKWIEELRNKYKVTVDREVLKTIK